MPTKEHSSLLDLNAPAGTAHPGSFIRKNGSGTIKAHSARSKRPMEPDRAGAQGLRLSGILYFKKLNT